MAFLAETAGLGDGLGLLLMRLPPSFAWDPHVAHGLLRRLLRES